MNHSYELLCNFIRKYLRLSQNDDSWRLITKNQGFFLFSDAVNESTWNAFAERHLLTKISASVQGNLVSLAYKNKEISFSLNENREDGILFIFHVAALVFDDFKIFYCKDSWHSDDLAFLAVPNDLWSEINTDQNAKLIGHRLVSLNFSSFEIFMDQAFNASNRNEYLSNNLSVLISGSALPTPEEWVEMFAEKKINVEWRKYAQNASVVYSVPNQDYQDWYLQETHRLDKTTEGLRFKEVLIFNDSFRLSFEKIEFNKKAWTCLLQILVRYNKVLIQSGEKVFSQKAWEAMYS